MWGPFCPGQCRVSPTTDAIVSGLSHSALMPWREACSSYIFIFLFLTFWTTRPTASCLAELDSGSLVSFVFPLFSYSQSCLTLCDPMDCSTPGLLVLHHLLEFAPIHVHRVSDAIHSSHPLLSPSPPAFNLSHHQSLFQ